MAIRPYWGAMVKPAKKGHAALIDAAIRLCEQNNAAGALACLLTLKAKRRYAGKGKDAVVQD